MITVTVEEINGVAIPVGSNAINMVDRAMFTRPPQPSTANTTSSKCLLWIGKNVGGAIVTENWLVTETYAAVLLAITQDEAESGAELLANKDATGGYVGLTLFKINFKNALNTITSFFTNANTVARTYTFQDRNGTIADDTDLALKADLAGPTLTGVPKAPSASATTNTVQIATTEMVQGRSILAAYGTATGTDTYSVSTSPAYTIAGVAADAGKVILVRFTNANSGASTLDVGGGGAKAIVRRDNATALSAADIAADSTYYLVYNGTAWVLLP